MIEKPSYSKRPCFIANWKMNKGVAETKAYLQFFAEHLPKLKELSCDVIVAPPFTALFSASRFLKEISMEVQLAAQNVYFEKTGAFTGEISPEMLSEFECAYVIIGHSERRHHFGETNTDVYRKLNALGKTGMLPILCIGETFQERRAGKTWNVLKRQLETALEGNDHSIADWVIAYEPVWAIGTGETPEPDEVASIHRQIEDFLGDQFGEALPRVLYGGSVKENNVADFMSQSSIDGVLVGGASLSAESFINMIESGTMSKQHLTTNLKINE
ncbi:MAG: triose-phosphate isomerase [Nitrospiria bacterium]